jgi:WD40 repeat protein
LNVVEKLKDSDSRWLWFIDQFEEVFTNCGEEEVRQQFLQGLADVIAQADDSLRVVLGMRADFQEHFSYYPAWGKLINQNSYFFVAEMDPEELRQAIEQPAAQHGIVFEEGLVKQIIGDVQGQKGYLPLLQYTLDLLWKRECETQNERGEAHIEDRTLNWQTYQDLQGVRGALKTQIEQIYQQMSLEQQQATKSILLKLVNIVQAEGGDRVVSRQAHRDEFAEGTTSDTLQRLIDENLLVSSLAYEDRETYPGMAADRARKQVAIVELAHEILLVSWDRLKQWIEQEKEAIALKNFLTDETQRWQRVRNERGEQAAREELLQGTRLEQIQALRRAGAFEQLGGLRKIENQFLDASLTEGERKARQAQRRRRNAMLGLSIFSGVALVLASVAGWQWRQAQKESIVSQAQAARALYLSGNRVESLIESLEAYQKQENSWLMGDRFLRIDRNVAQFIYPSQQMANSITLQHKDFVNHVAFSPDGNILASANNDNVVEATVKLWTRQGNLLQTLQHKGEINHIAFSPDGDAIASASANKTVKLWNRQGELLQTLQHEAEINHIAFSPDGDAIASASANKTVKLWNRQGELLQTLQHEAEVYRLAFSPDGNTLASASADKTVKLWNRQGERLHTLEHQDSVLQVAFSPDGNTLASASADKTVKLWTRQGNPLQTLQHEAEVYRLAFSPNGNTLASASADKTVKLWTRQGNPLQTLQHEAEVYRLAFSPDGNTLASASSDDTVKLWNRHGKLLHTLGHKDGVTHVAFSPDGNTLASASYDGTVKLWSSQEERLQTLQHEAGVYHVAFSPDSNTIASANGNDTVKLWSRQGKLLHTLKHEDAVRHVAFSPDGNTLASASYDYTMKLWTRQGEHLHTFQHEGMVRHVVFSLDSNTLASASGKKVKLWSRRGELLQTLQHQDWVNHVTFSSDGNTIASASDDDTVKLWNRQGKRLQTLQHDNNVNHVTFSQDDNTLASASSDGTVKLLTKWKTGDELMQQGCQWLQDNVKPERWQDLTICENDLSK